MLCVKVELSQTIVICVVYLPPNPILLQIQSLSSHLSQFLASCNIILLGDFNLPEINWDTLCGNSAVTDVFCDICFEYNLLQLITRSTHIHGNILDLVLTNNEDLIDSISICFNDNVQISSDHFPITFESSHVRSQPSVNETQHAYDYSKADFSRMNLYICNSDILNCLYFSDVETTWAIIKLIIYEAMTLFIPKFQFHSKQYPKWFIKELHHQLKCLHTLRRTYKRSPSDYNAARLSQAEESFQSNATTAKSTYETDLITNFATNSNPNIYHHIRSSTKSATILPTVYFNDTSASSNTSRANLFNQYFYSVFTPPSLSTNYTNTTPLPSGINAIVFSEDEVYSALNQLDPNKATGINTISPKILKHCALSLTRPLCHLFNLSLTTGAIPQEWKVHLIVPVYKSAERSSVQNYRPISLLCNTSKVLESLFYNRIINHVLDNITTCQFGFLPGRSTTQQLLLYLNDIYQATSQGYQADSIYLDFRKAFDSVPHNKLLVKLSLNGIKGNLWNWFNNYLHNRSQCVKICSSISDFLPVLSGVPQGSILGPLLFLIYINDIKITQFSNLFLFADDAKLYKIIIQLSDYLHLQQDLNQLHTWTIDCDLLLSVNKCIHLSFNSVTRLPPCTQLINTLSHNCIHIVIWACY